MYRIYSILILLAAAFCAAPSVSAYSPEMQMFTDEISKYMPAEAGTVSYDGNAIIFELSDVAYAPEDLEMIKELDDFDVFKPYFVDMIAQSMGVDGLKMFGAIIQQYDTKLIIRQNIEGKKYDIVLEGTDLLNYTPQD